MNEIGRYALIGIAVAAIVGIVLVAVRVFGIAIPWWFEAVCWIVLAALVCMGAVKLIMRMANTP